MRGCLCTLTRAALDGPHSGGGVRRGGGPQRHALVVLRTALLDGSHVAVAPHAEAARHRQVQGFHRLRLQLAEHRLAHRLELPVHLHLTHLADGAHGTHAAVVPGAELRRREQPRRVKAVEASVDGDLTDRPQVTVTPDLEFGGVLIGNPGGEQRRVCVESCSTVQPGVRQGKFRLPLPPYILARVTQMPSRASPVGSGKKAFDGKSLRAIIIPSAHEIMSSITFS